ncbi:MAG TPA: hypothetical protein VK963_01050 [Candidatus Saccharimonadales bacterium]|nr:hypothetical protein [Candidatus Saccharimonadales bacterium]
MKNIEVEVRGLLTSDRYASLSKQLESEGQFKTTKNRVLLDYSTFLPNANLRERQEDIRLRVTNGTPEIIVKLGRWGGSESRKELSVLAETGSFDTLVQVFGVVGLTKAMLCVRKSQVYDYRGIEFALVEVPNHSFYFEAEKMVSEDLVPAAKDDIAAVCTELGLKVFDDQAFFQYVEKLNQEANEIFDFASYQENYFRDRFGV